MADPKLDEFLRKVQEHLGRKTSPSAPEAYKQVPTQLSAIPSKSDSDALRNLEQRVGLFLDELQIGDFAFIHMEDAFVRLSKHAAAAYTIKGFKFAPKPVPVTIYGSLANMLTPLKANYIGIMMFLRYEIPQLGVGSITSSKILSVEHWRGEEQVRKVV